MQEVAKKYSPGPWRVCGEDRGICICLQVWSVSADMPVADVNTANEESVPFPDEETMKHNAVLISAAPELLEALQAVLKLQKSFIFSTPTDRYKFAVAVDAANAAISKATSINIKQTNAQ